MVVDERKERTTSLAFDELRRPSWISNTMHVISNSVHAGACACSQSVVLFWRIHYLLRALHESFAQHGELAMSAAVEFAIALALRRPSTQHGLDAVQAPKMQATKQAKAAAASANSKGKKKVAIARMLSVHCSAEAVNCGWR